MEGIEDVTIKERVEGEQSGVNGSEERVKLSRDEASVRENHDEPDWKQALADLAGNDTETPDDNTQYVFGMETRLKSLYEGAPKCQCCTNWVEEYPSDLDLKVEALEDTERCAVVRRYKKSHGDSVRSLDLHSIVIQSPVLQEFLAEIFKEYGDLLFSTKRVILDAPFVPLFHKWDILCETRDILSGEEITENQKPKEHLNLLIEAVQEQIELVRTAHRDLLSSNAISFEYLWTIFPPGELIVAKTPNKGLRACEVVSSRTETLSGGQRGFVLSVNYVDWDGLHFGTVAMEIAIPEFAKIKQITSLPVHPLRSRENAEELRAKFLERGRQFVELASIKHVSYKGLALLVPGDAQPPAVELVEGRIIIDAAQASYSVRDMCPPVTPLVTNEAPGTQSHGFKTNPLYSHGAEIDALDSVLYDVHALRAGASTAPKREVLEELDEDKTHDLSNDQLVCCSPVVKGYSLTSKRWGLFEVELIGDITWDEHAFASLMIPKDHKEVLFSLVDAQMKAEQGDFDDIIAGKGKGYIILLSGPPGVGKTLTAESVAENMRLPLYVMSSGELGATVGEIEKQLGSILKLTSRWKAILLIDEADVYLEQRSRLDIERNRLVSVFLRLLEYHKGLLFLTTNRLDCIDTAFESRIHLSLSYDNLDVSARRAVWKTFAGRGLGDSKLELTDADLDDLASYNINGRQIKNVCKTSRLLASRTLESVTLEHIKRALFIIRPAIRVDGQRVEQNGDV